MAPTSPGSSPPEAPLSHTPMSGDTLASASRHNFPRAGEVGAQARGSLFTLTEEGRCRQTKSLAHDSRQGAGLGSTLSSVPLCSAEGSPEL